MPISTNRPSMLPSHATVTAL